MRQLRKTIKTALRYDPKNAKGYAALGWSQVEMQQYADAERSLTQSLKIDKSDALAHNNLGRPVPTHRQNERSAKNNSKRH
jgi:Tfp pilus assembly protein PilF